MRLLRRLRALLLTLGLIALVAAALLMTGLRLALPFASDYRDSLAATLSERLGYRVAIGTLGLRLSGMDPRLTLGGVTLSDPDSGASALTLKTIELDLDPLASLRARSPQFRALSLVGAHLVLRRDASGRISLEGLGALKGDDPAARALFLSQGRLNLIDTDILIQDARLGGVLVRLVDTRLALVNEGDRHLVELTARPVPPAPIAAAASADARLASASVPDGNRLRLIADLEGPPTDIGAWSGRLYLSLAAGNLGLLLPADLFARQTLDTAAATLEAWASVRKGRLEQSTLHLDLAGLGLLPAVAGPAAARAAVGLTVDRLSALAQVRATAAGWRVRLADLDARAGGGEIAGLKAAVDLSREGQAERLGVSARRIDLGSLAGLLRASPWPLPKPLAAVAASRPRGGIDALALSAEPPPTGGQTPAWRWALSGALARFGIDGAPPIPGGDGIDARVVANQDGGRLTLASADASLDLNPLFTEVLAFKQLRGRLDWRRSPAGAWRLAASDLSLQAADIAGGGRFTLDLPTVGSPILDLSANFHDGDASHVRPYLPAGIMKPSLVEWLQSALVSGRVVRGDAIFHGALDDFPFRQGKGRFELTIGFQDLLLDYQKGWPPITAASGHLKFLNQGLRIQVDRGRIYDSDFSRGLAEFPDLRAARRLLIHGQADGPFADAKRVLADSPLKPTFGRLADALQVTGRSRVELDIDLPLTDEGEIGIAGRLTWPGPATLGIAGTPVALSDLDGKLAFTEQSLEAKPIVGQMWGRPVRVEIATEGAGEGDRSITRIRAQAQTPAAELGRRFPGELWRSLNGKLDWNLEVALRNKDVNQEQLPLDFRVSSDLRGLVIDLPPPLGKRESAAASLDLRGTLTPGRSLTVAGHLGETAANLQLGLDATPAALKSARVRFGATAAPAPEREGLFLDGTIAELDVPRWLEWSETSRRDNAGRSGTEPASGAGGDPVLTGGQLRIERLLLGGLRLRDVRLDAGRQGADWRFDVQAAELAGRLTMPSAAGGGPLMLALDRLDLKPLIDQTGMKRKKGGSDKREPAARLDAVPSFDLRAQDLRWGDSRLGALALSLRKDAAGIRLPHIELTGTGHSLNGDGEWVRDAAGGRSRLNLTAGAADLGDLLRDLTGKRLLQAGKSTASLQIAWPGGMDAFSLAKGDGFIGLDVGPGRFLEVEPGVGRLLGFLDFSALGRRLALDFSDLYGQGFAFERTSGRIAIRAGKARFEDVVIDGSAGKVIVGGTTDLASKQLDQTVTVEPKLGSSVALASAVAGGPVVGAAVYLVDRVAGNPLDRLGRYRYRVTGPWGDPELTRLGWEPLAGAEPVKSGPPAAVNAEKQDGKNLFLDPN